MSKGADIQKDDDRPVLLVINKENVLIHIGDPAKFKKNLLAEYVMNGYTLRTITFKEWGESGYKLYEKIPNPEPKPAT